MNQEALNQQIESLKDELSRIDVAFNAQVKDLGLTAAEIAEAADPKSPEEKKLLAHAQEKAKRAGEARASQSTLATPPAGKAPGARRQGVVRL